VRLPVRGLHMPPIQAGHIAVIHRPQDRPSCGRGTGAHAPYYQNTRSIGVLGAAVAGHTRTRTTKVPGPTFAVAYLATATEQLAAL
jgi:hypothetical protein